MPNLGYKPPSTPSPDQADLDASSVLAYVADAASANSWVYAIGARLQRPDAGSPNVTLGAYAVDTGGNPASLLGQSAAFAVSGTTEAEYQRDLGAVVKVGNGASLGLAVLATGARVRIGMAGANWVPGADSKTFFWDVGTTALHSPFQVDASSYEGNLSVWAIAETNVAPNAPANCAPGATTQSAPTQITVLTPTFAGDFRDDNEAVGSFAIGTCDKLKQARVQVYNDATGALVWDSGAQNASSADQAARRFSLAYTGPALANGTVYRWQSTVSDQWSAWSAVSGWRYFTIGAGRIDTTTASPTGKLNTQTPGPFVAKWVHTGGLATNGIEVRILDNDSGATVRASATLAIAVANNGTVSVTWAQTAFASLPWGPSRYVWQMRGRDTGNVFSGWSGGVPFWTNDPPAVPAPYSPAANAIVTTYPLLQATCADTDDAGTQLTLTFRIMNATGTVLQTRTGTWNATAGRYQYQVVAADFSNSFADYLWDCYAFDGHVWSGGATTVGTAQNSADRKLTYASGPVVVITNPTTPTITTNTSTLTWTCPGQTKRRIVVQRAPDYATIHDTGWVTSTGHGYTLPPLLSTGEQLHEGDVLHFVVYAQDANGLTGQDDANAELDYPTPPALQPSIVLIKGRGDLTPTVVQVEWPASSYAQDQFRYYRLERRISADMLLANPALDPAPVVFKRFEVSQNGYTDWEATSGVEYEYRLNQYVTQGADVLHSPSRTVVVTVAFEATILHAVTDPADKRVVFDARRGRTITPVVDFAVVAPWNQQKPIQFESNTFYHEIDTEWVLAAQTPQDANYDLWRLEQMVTKGGILCYRDGRGHCFYGRFSTPPVEIDPPGGRLRSVRATFRELAYDPSAKD